MYIATRKLYFYQLPSHNRGMEYKHWIISDLGVDTQNFTIDPEQDLLVLAEASDAAQEPQFLNLHLRSMSNNEVHPKTSHGCSVLVYHPLSRLVPARLLLNLEVFGHLLAVAFHSRGRYIPSYVVVWNWTTGTELLVSETDRFPEVFFEFIYMQRVQTTGDHASFTLLSENLLVLSRSLERYFTTTDVPGEFGFLDVYQFDPQTATSTASTPVASFALPVLKEQEFVATIYLRCGPTTGASNFVSSPSRSPKVFDLAPHSRLLCLNVNISRDPRISSRIFPRTLCIPSCLLLDILANYQAHHSNPLVVPWVEWAEKTSWVDTGALRIRIERSQLGQRIAGFDWGSVFGPELLILDFNQHRVNQTMLEEQAVWEVCTPGTKAPAGDTLKQIGEAVFCGREDLARRKYNKTKFWVGESADVTDAVMIDDEHGECMRILLFEVLSIMILDVVIIETVRYIPWLSRILLC